MKFADTLDWEVLIFDGEAYYQERGKKPVILKKGDVSSCNKDTEHWHASTKEQDVTYLAINGGAEPTIWTEKLT